MKILVTGGAGFIGSHVVDLLEKKGHEIIVIDNLTTGKKENINPKADFYHTDLLDFGKIKDIFNNHQPEIIYHLAAQTNLRKSINNPLEDAKINLLATLNLLELSKKYSIKHFIFSSTGAIYGDEKRLPIYENNPQYPISPYACSKLSIERYLNFYNKVFGLKYTILRYSNVYGPRQNPETEAGVIAIFFNKLFSKQTPVIFGGIQTRDFIYINDVTRANLLALKDTKSRTYNIGTNKETDIIEIFAKINKYFKNKFEPTYLPMKDGEQKRCCLNCTKIKSSLNWEPLTNIDEGLDKTYCHHLKLNNGIKNEIQNKSRISL